jgi:hypothetical protein
VSMLNAGSPRAHGCPFVLEHEGGLLRYNAQVQLV